MAATGRNCTIQVAEYAVRIDDAAGSVILGTNKNPAEFRGAGIEELDSKVI